MAEHIAKEQLLEKMQSSYAIFTALLSPLSEAQLTTPGVNGGWSIKDNIAHLSAWHRRQIARNEAVRQGVEIPDPTPGMSIEEINELYYKQNKDRSLADVLDEFDETARAIQESVESLTDEQLNSPIDWLNGRSLAPYVAGDSYEHYEEHTEIIQHWLAQQSK
ncbi:hypothetical protein KSF_023640 [Reticulibacter mediterranei]|uniref:ClbS/DfsB family four-helix bundle protein n=1 Tax=Reticulibacter mediterranei TaxID=2778369 RepID=A0A8J3IMU4_9CHLR|nr:ClbS/DfsB family four-helix bundle protein [Reticulibacter mediterranei]GHO92316.1 hypothetical protein KSF_023640 [Reticulibacter mediterranei]